MFFFFLFNTRFCLLVGIRLYLKTVDNFMRLIFEVDSGLGIYHLSSLSKWIPFLTQSCQLLCSFCGSLLGLLLIWFSPKWPRLGFRRSATTLYHSLTVPSSWTRWTTSFGHTSRTSPTWPPTTRKPAWSSLSAEYSPSSRWHFLKRHAPSSGFVSRRWLRLKAATLNRCQLYYTIKLPELIFSGKVLK